MAVTCSRAVPALQFSCDILCNDGAVVQVLFSEDGYIYLDVRPALEYEEAGRVKGSVNIPIANAKRVWDPEQKKKVIKKEDNNKFAEQVGLPQCCRHSLDKEMCSHVA